ncbi:hypothetical protein ACWJJH_05050 [Endozoicomonadaceae bacterium StTr2]
MLNRLCVLCVFVLLASVTQASDFLGSLYFGQVPAGAEELRQLYNCQPDRPDETAITGYRLSDPSLNGIFEADPAEDDGECLVITVSFSPPNGLQDKYRVYGRGTNESTQRVRGSGGPIAGAAGTSQDYLQAMINGYWVNLAPVRGVGVSRAEWDQVIVKAGWRYGGNVTLLQHKKEESRPKPLGFDAVTILDDRFYSVHFNGDRSLTVFELDEFDIPVPVLGTSGELLNYGKFNRTQWIASSEESGYLATLGLLGETIIWDPTDEGLDKVHIDECSASECGVLGLLHRHEPVFSDDGECLIAADGSSIFNTGKQIRSYSVPDDGVPRELGETLLSGDIWGMSTGPDDALTFINMDDNSLSECQISDYQCGIHSCTNFKPQGLSKPRASAYSSDGLWFAASGCTAQEPYCSLVNLWPRDGIRTINQPPETFEASWVDAYSGWNLKFHPDDDQLVVLGLYRVSFFEIDEDGDLFLQWSFEHGEGGAYKPRNGNWIRNKVLVFNEEGSRLYIGYTGSEGGVMMYDELIDGESEYIIDE